MQFFPRTGASPCARAKREHQRAIIRRKVEIWNTKPQSCVNVKCDRMFLQSDAICTRFSRLRWSDSSWVGMGGVLWHAKFHFSNLIYFWLRPLSGKQQPATLADPDDTPFWSLWPMLYSGRERREVESSGIWNWRTPAISNIDFLKPLQASVLSNGIIRH